MKEKNEIDWPLAIAAALFTAVLFIWRNSQ